jgi:hypothetical protein
LTPRAWVYKIRHSLTAPLRAEELTAMTARPVADILEDIYASLYNDNENIDGLIADLKAALGTAGQKEVTVDPARLVQNNRQGRKMMQSYFKKRGVSISFSE